MPVSFSLLRNIKHLVEMCATQVPSEKSKEPDQIHGGGSQIQQQERFSYGRTCPIFGLDPIDMYDKVSL